MFKRQFPVVAAAAFAISLIGGIAEASLIAVGSHPGGAAAVC
jgi:hypothetical protein